LPQLVILLLLLLALFGGMLTPSDPYKTSMLSRLKPIGTANFPLGTDELGRDMLSRLMVGARLSLFMGITPVILAFIIGSAVGITAGYAGGYVNSLIMRTIDVFYAFPSVLLAIALSGALGAGHHKFSNFFDSGIYSPHRTRSGERDYPDKGS